MYAKLRKNLLLRLGSSSFSAVLSHHLKRNLTMKSQIISTLFRLILDAL